jgi:hypothetical protein
MKLLTKRNMTIGAVVIGIPALVLAWWLISPLFLDSVVDEEFPVADEASDNSNPDDPTETTAATTGDAEEAVSDDSDGGNLVKPTAPVDVAPVATGQFRDADSSHRGSGTATIYELEEGSRILRFEDFEVTNGPDLHVYLVPADNTADEVSVEGYVDLGELKGNIGDQNYEIPPDTDISEFKSVVIWCEPFAVVFSVASLG